jgi:hypothetical protein
MGALRRIVIAMADALAIVCIIGLTIGGGAIAAFYVVLQSQVLGRPAGSSAVFAFMVGAVTGFILAALFAAIIFSLSEIAANTLATVRLLEGENFKEKKEQAEAGPAVEPDQPPARGDGPFLNVRSELSSQSQRILDIAREKGFEVDISKDNRAILVETHQGPIRLNSNRDIEDFGRRARLI